MSLLVNSSHLLLGWGRKGDLMHQEAGVRKMFIYETSPMEKRSCHSLVLFKIISRFWCILHQPYEGTFWHPKYHSAVIVGKILSKPCFVLFHCSTDLWAKNNRRAMIPQTIPYFLLNWTEILVFGRTFFIVLKSRRMYCFYIQLCCRISCLTAQAVWLQVSTYI